MNDHYFVPDPSFPNGFRRASLMEWGAWRDGTDYATPFSEGGLRIAFDEFSDGSSISTVFLGINHNWSVYPPVLFETMIFGGKRDGEQHRYLDSHDAFQSHQQLATELRRESSAHQESQ